MAKTVYSKDGRLMFTKEMKEEYTILMPMMLPIHFKLLKEILSHNGYNMELLDTSHPQIVNEGLQNVHNDTCYPALLVIGQLLDAIKSGKYHKDKLALIITQTGGGCRASNYIHLLRKALKKNNLEDIPVISFNISGMEKNPGFKLTIRLIFQLLYAVIYGDLLMLLSNQTRPYEINPGDTDRKVSKWVTRLGSQIIDSGLFDNKRISTYLKEITEDFASIPTEYTEKIKVGVVGEIYIKYSPLGNNNLEDFLFQEGTEVVVPGLMDFLIFKLDNSIVDTRLFGIKWLKGFISHLFKGILIRMQNMLIDAVKLQPKFRAPAKFEHIKTLVRGYAGEGNKMGEGWLLIAEMLELIDSGVNNIVCAQPFGCLPNHVVGKGMIRRIRENHTDANIVAIDYDPGATRINQENRIKLMLSTAKQNLLSQQKPKDLQSPTIQGLAEESEAHHHTREYEVV